MAAQIPHCPSRTRPHGPQPQPTRRCNTGARPRVTQARTGERRGVALREVSIRGGPPLGSGAGANRSTLHHHHRSLTKIGGGSQWRRRRQLTGNEKAASEIHPRGLSRRRSPT
jgi:hypothetical protein